MPGPPCFLVSKTEIKQTIIEGLKTQFSQLVDVIHVKSDVFSYGTFKPFFDFARRVQLTKAIALQELQKCTYSLPSGVLKKSSKHPEYHVSIQRPLSRRAKVEDFYSVESEISERLHDLVGVDNLRGALNRNLKQVLGGKSKATLIVGPPGCGKTFSVRALAGSSNIILISTTAAKLEGHPTANDLKGCNQIQMQQGSNTLSRLAHLLETARRLSPSIVFIDEIHYAFRDKDSIVTQALLSCLDGFEKDDRGILVIGATSHEDIKKHPDVDQALFRAGRFREEIRVPLPDFKTRQDYLLKHLPKLGGNEDVLERTVFRMTGKSIADLKDLVDEIEYDLEYNGRPLQVTVDRQSLWFKYGITGDEYINRMPPDRLIWHEAGHAVVQMKLFPRERIDCVTICRNGDNWGFVAPITPDCPLSTTGLVNLKRMAVGLAGQQSEIIAASMHGKVDLTEILNRGSESDISKVNGIARVTILQYGLDPNYGPKTFSYGDEIWKILPKKEEAHIDRLLTKAESLARETLEDNLKLLMLVYENLKIRGTLHYENLSTLQSQCGKL